MLNPDIQAQEERHIDQIRGLQSEIAELKALLSNVHLRSGGRGATELLGASDPAESGQPALLTVKGQEPEELADGNTNVEASGDVDYVQTGNVPKDGFEQQILAGVRHTELSDPRERSPKGYYGQHTLFQFFGEVRGSPLLDHCWTSVIYMLIFLDRSVTSSHLSRRQLMNGSNLSECIL
jgi:hypothetical protein